MHLLCTALLLSCSFSPVRSLYLIAVFLPLFQFVNAMEASKEEQNALHSRYLTLDGHRNDLLRDLGKLNDYIKRLRVKNAEDSREEDPEELQSNRDWVNHELLVLQSSVEHLQRSAE